MGSRSVFSVMVGAMALFACGTFYSFPVYDAVLNNTFHYSRHESAVVVGCGLVGFSLGFPAGILYHRITAMWLCVISCVISTVAYLLLWSATKATKFYVGKAWLLGFYNFIAGHGLSYVYQTCLAVVLRNISRRYWGGTIGALHVPFGLSPGVIFIFINMVLSNNAAAAFLFCLAVAVFANFAGIIGLRLEHTREFSGNPMSSQADVRTLTTDAIEYAPSTVDSEDEEATDGRRSRTLVSPSPIVRRDRQEVPISESSDREILLKSLSTPSILSVFSTFAFHATVLTFVFGSSSAAGMFWSLNDALTELNHTEMYSNCIIAFAISFSVALPLLGLFADFIQGGTPRNKLVVVGGMSFVLIGVFLVVFIDAPQMWYAFAVSTGVLYACSWAVVPTILAGKFGLKNFTYLWSFALVVSTLCTIVVQVAHFVLRAHVEDAGSLMTVRISVIIHIVLAFCSMVFACFPIERVVD